MLVNGFGEEEYQVDVGTAGQVVSSQPYHYSPIASVNFDTGQVTAGGDSVSAYSLDNTSGSSSSGGFLSTAGSLLGKIFGGGGGSGTPVQAAQGVPTWVWIAVPTVALGAAMVAFGSTGRRAPAVATAGYRRRRRSRR